MKILCFSLLIISLLACGNKQQNMPVNEVKAKDSILEVVQTTLTANVQTSVSSSRKTFDDLLKSGQKGIFEDSTFSAIIESDFAVGITHTAVPDENPNQMDFKYTVTTFFNEKGIWTAKGKKMVTSVSADEPKVKLEDIDKDGKKDIMLLLSHDGRGNEQYTLFLMKNKELIEVRGFNEVYAPTYDKKKKLIVSTNNYHHGSNTDFYKIVKDSAVFIEGIETIMEKGQELTRKYTKKE